MQNFENLSPTPYIGRAFAACRGLWCLHPALLLSLIMALPGCGESPLPATSLALERGLAADPESLDPHKSRSTVSGEVLRDLGEGLMGYTPDGELVPRAAEHVEVSGDGLEYRFRLRRTARWSNGEPVTAHDFVYSFRRLLDPATAAFYAQSVIDVGNAPEILAGDRPTADLAATAPGDLELSIRLSKPTPYFLALLTHPSTFPVYRPAVEKHGSGFARPGRLITNGA
jgi:oligopeptide transport system substrate-binding protein